jgi:D-glycerate 3-kinase
VRRALFNALNQTITIARSRATGRIPIIGVAGAQGSGKTTLVKAYAAANPGVAQFSLDDVYLPSAFRRLIADEVHPLFATRGPPGTHNLMQLDETLDELQEATEASATQLPAFDKAADEPVPGAKRPVFRGRPSLILIDGWCLGATPQEEATLASPVNGLETAEDKDGVWRREVNANIGGGYQQSFARIDALLWLKPPSFEVVHRWRCEQEAELLGRPLTVEDDARVARFIQHFERITRHMMAGGVKADVVVELDEARRVAG